MRKLYFVTKNNDKFIRTKNRLNNVNLKRININLPHLQGNIYDIIKQKCKSAAKIINKPLIVEETFLCSNILNGLPGACTKYIFNRIGDYGVYKLLNAFNDKSCYLITLIGYIYDKDCEPIIFENRCDGFLVSPKGKSKKNSFENIFRPYGDSHTYGEMSDDKYVKNWSIVIKKLGDALSYDKIL